MAIAIETAVNFGDTVNDGTDDWKLSQVMIDGEGATVCQCYKADGTLKMIAGDDLTVGAMP